MSTTDREYAEYESAAAHKLLADQRDAYVAQSAATKNGKVAEFHMPDLRNIVARMLADSENGA